MNSRVFSAIVLAASCGLASEARAQQLGIDGGLFLPSNSKTKRIFGSSFKSLGPGFGRVQVLERKIYPDFDFVREKENGNRATVVFAGAKLLTPIGRLPLSDTPIGFAPYAGVGINLTYADIDVPEVGVEDRGFGAGASVILGASFGKKLFGEARYRVASSAADFNFSGAQVVVGVRF